MAGVFTGNSRLFHPLPCEQSRRECTDRSRGYCLEMICADFLAGVNLDNGNPEVLLQSISRFFKFLPQPQKQAFLDQATENAS